MKQLKRLLHRWEARLDAAVDRWVLKMLCCSSDCSEADAILTRPVPEPPNE